MRKLLVTAAVLIATSATAPDASGYSFLVSEEDRVHTMVNATRTAHGLPPLQRLEGLTTLARQQSVRMVEQNNLFHNQSLKAELDALGIGWLWSGENVGVGPTVDAIQEAFVRSAHHYENIVRPNYTALGVGVVAKPNGYRYVTQVFAEVKGTGAPPPPSTPAPTAAPPPPPAAVVEPRSAPVPTPEPAPEPSAIHIAIEGGIVVPHTALHPLAPLRRPPGALP